MVGLKHSAGDGFGTWPALGPARSRILGVEGFGEVRAGGPDEMGTEGFGPNQPGPPIEPGSANRDEFDRQKISARRFANSQIDGQGFRVADARFVEPLGRCATSTFASLLPDRLAQRETE